MRTIRGTAGIIALGRLRREIGLLGIDRFRDCLCEASGRPSRGSNGGSTGWQSRILQLTIL